MSDHTRTEREIAEALERLRKAPYDERAWRTLYHELWPYVTAIVSRSLGVYDDTVHDVAQETFLRLLRAGPASDFQSVAALRAYLRMIALNTARTFHRERRQERRLVDDSLQSEDAAAAVSAQPDQELLESETLRSVLSTLGDTDRAFVDYLVSGYSLREIADALGITYGTAGVRLHRLRRKLAKLLAQQEMPRKVSR